MKRGDTLSAIASKYGTSVSAIQKLNSSLIKNVNFIRSQQSEITEFDESLVRKLIQQITVYDDHFTVRFKSGLEIDINE